MVALATEQGFSDQCTGYRTTVVVRRGKQPHPLLPDGTDPNGSLNSQITLDYSDRSNVLLDAERFLQSYRANPTLLADAPVHNGKMGAFEGPSLSNRNKMIQLGSMPIRMEDIPQTDDPNTYYSDEIITRMLIYRGVTEQELRLMSIHAQRMTQVEKVIISKSGDRANVALERNKDNAWTGSDFASASFSAFYKLSSKEPNFDNEPDTDNLIRRGVSLWQHVDRLREDKPNIPVTVVDNNAITRVMEARTKTGMRIWQLPSDMANKTVALYRRIIGLK